MPGQLSLQLERASCIGCKFLYKMDHGYSNYTVTETTVDCALDANPKLPADEPVNWIEDPRRDNWPMTQHHQCILFEARHDLSEGMIHLDVDAETGPADCTSDRPLAILVAKHSGRELHGSEQWR